MKWFWSLASISSRPSRSLGSPMRLRGQHLDQLQALLGLPVVVVDLGVDVAGRWR